MKIVVGIGNPGRKYAATRHNIGFMVLDRMAARHDISTWRSKFHAQVAEGRVSGARCLLMKPETYMNESGRAVGAAVNWCRTELQDVMIVCDDFNLPLGRLRVRGRGSSGGHNGLDSIAAHLDSDEVPRIRIGIGNIESDSAKDFVLSGFDNNEKEIVSASLERAVDALETWLEFGLARCQNDFNADPEVTSGAKENDNNEEADA